VCSLQASFNEALGQALILTPSDCFIVLMTSPATLENPVCNLQVQISDIVWVFSPPSYSNTSNLMWLEA